MKTSFLPIAASRPTITIQADLFESWPALASAIAEHYALDPDALELLDFNHPITGESLECVYANGSLIGTLQTDRPQTDRQSEPQP